MSRGEEQTVSLSDRLRQQQRAYRLWAPVYDPVYGRVLGAAHRQLASRARAAGRVILEVGVGTGLVLPHYGRDCQVEGIDVSPHMIAKAQRKVMSEKLSQVSNLHLMDARQLRFAEATFDAVTMPFVITLLDDPEAALDECARVLKPGGEIVIASKISTGGMLQTLVERLAAPLARQVGWSSSFRLSRIVEWVDRRTDMELVEVLPLAPAGFFKIVRLRRVTGALWRASFIQSCRPIPRRGRQHRRLRFPARHCCLQPHCARSRRIAGRK